MSLHGNTSGTIKNTEEKGMRVLATIFGGEQRELVVWEEDGEVVYLCSPQSYKKLIRGEQASRPIGFHRCDVQWPIES